MNGERGSGLKMSKGWEPSGVNAGIIKQILAVESGWISKGIDFQSTKLETKEDLFGSYECVLYWRFRKFCEASDNKSMCVRHSLNWRCSCDGCEEMDFSYALIEIQLGEEKREEEQEERMAIGEKCWKMIQDMRRHRNLSPKVPVTDRGVDVKLFAFSACDEFWQFSWSKFCMNGAYWEEGYNGDRWECDCAGCKAMREKISSEIKKQVKGATQQEAVNEVA